jgi:hypothetical protein
VAETRLGSALALKPRSLQNIGIIRISDISER